MPLKHKGKIALVTGANKGIGFEVARQLGAEGITVLVGARNPHLNSNSGTQTVKEGAAETVRQSRVPDDAPTGGFYETGGTVPW